MIFNNDILNIVLLLILFKIFYDYNNIKRVENFDIDVNMDKIKKNFINKYNDNVKKMNVDDIQNINKMVSNVIPNVPIKDIEKTSSYSVFSDMPPIRYEPIKKIGPFNVLNNDKYYINQL